jgi:ABC-type glycerol-3-phosphate transport system substrate-binding protein
MRRTSKTVVLLLVLCMLITMFAGCQKTTSTQGGTKSASVLNTGSVYPVVKSNLTLTMLGRRSASQGEWTDLKCFKKWQEITGVTLNMETVLDDNWDTTVSVRLQATIYPTSFTRAS